MYTKVLKLISMFLGIIVFIIGSVYFGYQIFKPDEAERIVLADEEPAIPEPEFEVMQPNDPRITDDTRIVYEYLDTNDNVKELREVTMPYYFLGMAEQDLSDALIEGWSIKKFDKSEVVLSKTVDIEESNYMLGVHNGYIAVYYNENTKIGNVMETIDKPISALSIDEQNRLINGIPITDEEQLIKVLEDYGS